jgi:Mrp family chromosome partitioning ATPase
MSYSFEILLKEAKHRADILPSKTCSVEHHNRRRKTAPPSTDCEIGNLISAVFLARKEASVRTVMFSSVEDSTRSDWVSARVAEALAVRTGRRICIVDAKPRTPALHEQFGQQTSLGLLDAMKTPPRTLDLVRPTWISDLFFLGAGNASLGASAALDPAGFAGVLQQLRGEFEHVLVAAPPLATYADALCIGSFVDGAILILTANTTRREAAGAAAERLNAAKVRVLGVVLDRRTYPIPEKIYQRL